MPGVGPIEASDIVKGFEIDDDAYVVLEPEELEQIKLESSRAVELAQFVDRAEIDPRYFEKPYYVTPEGMSRRKGSSSFATRSHPPGRSVSASLQCAGARTLSPSCPSAKG